MKRLSALIVAMALSPSQAGLAQSLTTPLGITTPLGLGVGAPVPPTGLPMGATQLATPGISPATAATVMQGTMATGSVSCGGATNLPAGGSGPAALFDGNMGAGMSPCNAIGTVLRPAQSASSPTGIGGLVAVGRVGIPMGSTELGVGGVSPPPHMTTIVPPSPLAAPLATAPSTMIFDQPSVAPQSSSAGTACAGVPGNINSTGISPGTSAGVC